MRAVLSCKVGGWVVAVALSAMTGMLPSEGRAQVGNSNDPEVCQVRFTRIQEERSSETGLISIVWTGDHNYSSSTDLGGLQRTSFEIVDNDGFFSTLVLAQINMRAPYRGVSINGRTWHAVPETEMDIAISALRMGAAFYPAAIRAGSQLSPAPANWARSLETMQGKQRHHEQ